MHALSGRSRDDTSKSLYMDYPLLFDPGLHFTPNPAATKHPANASRCPFFMSVF
jgi:hypothetical protein